MATIEDDAMKKLDGIYQKGNETGSTIQRTEQKQPQQAAARSANQNATAGNANAKSGQKKNNHSRSVNWKFQ